MDAMASQSVLGMVALFVGLVMFFLVVMPSGFTKNAVVPAAVVLGFTFTGITLRNSRRYSTPTDNYRNRQSNAHIDSSGKRLTSVAFLGDISKNLLKFIDCVAAHLPAGTLWIRARNRTYSVLAWRDPDEAEWLADLVRHKCGHG